jgi:hypothetical protein
VDRRQGLKLCVTFLSLVFAGYPVMAGCPHIEPGASYPWQTEGLMPGDKWADLLIKLDKRGRPLDCEMAKGNVDGETLFWMCRAVTAQAHFDPIVTDGQPVIGTVTRSMTIYGRLHHQADEAARKKFFAEHADYNPACYPR